MNKALRAALFGLPLFFTSCFGARAPEPPPAPRDAPAALRVTSEPRVENVILGTIDGVRWQEIFTGLDLAREAALSP